MEPFVNHYETLGVSFEATTSEIKKAYKKLAKVHHPDKKIGKRGEGQDDCPRSSIAYDFKRLQEAYEVLTNEETREQYDVEYKVFMAEAERLAKIAAKERAKKEAERAKEKAAAEEKRLKEERRRARREKKEAERLAREREEMEAAEKLSDELFVQQLCNDFGEAGDIPVFQMQSIDNHPDAREAAGTNAGAAGENPTQQNAQPSAQPDLNTPSEHVSADPRMSDPRLSADLNQDLQRISADMTDEVGRESIANLAKMARFSDPVIDDLTNSPVPSKVRRSKKKESRPKSPTLHEDPDIMDTITPTSTTFTEDPTID